MIITTLARHAGQSLRAFLDSLQSDVRLLLESSQLNYISRARIDGHNLVGSHNIKEFRRLSEGTYRFSFDKIYKDSFYSIVFASGGLDILIVNQSSRLIEVKCLKDTELSLICVGELK